MKFTMTAMIAMIGAPVAAAEAPDLIGTWTGTSRAVVAGSGGHYGEGGAALQFREVELTVEWIEQKDGRYIGTITSAGHTEPKLGVLSSDGKMFVTADLDGTSVGRIIDDDHFELCYTQTSTGSDHIIASCVDFERVKK